MYARTGKRWRALRIARTVKFAFLAASSYGNALPSASPQTIKSHACFKLSVDLGTSIFAFCGAHDGTL
jgi:hypothetical protein